MDGFRVSPDNVLHGQIFGADRPQHVSIILQDREKYVFKANFGNDVGNDRPMCVIRLEVEHEGSGKFATVAALQRIATKAVPNLVPQTRKVGKAQNADGRQFHLSVVDFVEGDILDDVWHQLSDGNQAAIVTELVEALSRLHDVRLDASIINDLKETRSGNGGENTQIPTQEGFFGGPHTGFMNDGYELLKSILRSRKLKKTFCTLEVIPGSRDVKIQSAFEDLGSVTITGSDIDKWGEDAVLLSQRPQPSQSHCSIKDIVHRRYRI